MAINISDNDPRVSYTATSGQTVFTVSFEFFEEADLTVYINGTEKTITTDYTVTGGDGSTGTVTLTSGATLGDKVVIVRDVSLQRTSDFTAGAAISRDALNEQLDIITAQIADVDDKASRALQLSDHDTAFGLNIPLVDDRKGKLLGFNLSTGAVEAGPVITDMETLASINADITTLAHIEDGTDATDAIQTVASNSSNVTTVAGIGANITTVAGISANVTTVAGAETNIGTVAGSISNVNTVAGIDGDITTVAGISANTTTVAGISANVTTVAGISADVTTVAGQTTNLQNVTDNLSAIQNAATKATEAASSATAAASSETAAATAQTAAESARDSALAAFDNFDDKYLGSKTADPTVDNDGDALVAGALYFNSSDGVMKVYTGSAWVAAYASLSGALLVANNLSDIQSASSARTNLGLGTSATVDTGTSANQIVKLDASAKLPAVDGSQLTGIEGVPSGVIAMWSGTNANIPTGWVLCDGNNSTPDLTDRFILGRAAASNTNSTGGANTVTLAEGNLPAHTHGIGNIATTSGGAHTHTLSGNTSSAGNHNHNGNTSNIGNHTHSVTGQRNNLTNSTPVALASVSSNGGGTYTKNTNAAGSHSHNLSLSNTGAHTHTLSGNAASAGDHTHTMSGNTGSVGSGTAVTITPVYYTLAFIMKT